MLTQSTQKYLESKYRNIPQVELRRLDEEFNIELKILERANHWELQ